MKKAISAEDIRKLYPEPKDLVRNDAEGAHESVSPNLNLKYLL